MLTVNPLKLPLSLWHSLWFLCLVLESNLSTFGFGNTTGVARNNFPMLLSQRKKSWSCEQIYQGFTEAVPKNCLTEFPNNIDIIYQQSFGQYVWELFEYVEGKFVFEHSEDSWLECLKTVFSHFKFDEVCCSVLPLPLWNSTLWLKVSLSQLSFFFWFLICKYALYYSEQRL